MKLSLIFMLLLASFNLFSADCGVVRGVTYSPDHGGLVGFSVKLKEKYLRITHRNNLEFVDLFAQEIRLDQSDRSFFVCLDQYEVYYAKYRNKKKSFGKVKEFRIYKNGKLRVNSADL